MIENFPRPEYTKFRYVSTHLYVHRGPGISCLIFIHIFVVFFVVTLPKMAPGPQNGLIRRVSQFYTICDKNQLLNTNIEKVTAVLVLRFWDAVPLGQVVPPGSDAMWLLDS